MTRRIDSPGIRDVVLVMGLTGWGKSWWSKLYSRKYNRKLVYDPTESFPVKQYLPVADIVDDILVNEEDTPVFNYGFVDEEEIPQAAGALFVLGNNLLVVEECATVFEKGQARLPEWGKRHVFYGRHRNCSLLLIAQRPTYMPIDVRSQANRVITFCQHEGTDMDWLQDFFGKERVKQLSTLPKFMCFDWCQGSVKQYSIVESVKKTFDVTLDKSNGSMAHLIP